MIEKIKDYFLKSQLFGEVEILNDRIIQGWVCNFKAPDTPILIEVIKENEILAQTTAKEFKPWLNSHRTSKDNNGFTLKLNDVVCDQTLIVFKSENKILKKLELKKLSSQKNNIEKSSVKINSIINNLLIGEVRATTDFSRPKLAIYADGFFLGEKIAFLPFTYKKNSIKKLQRAFTFTAHIPDSIVEKKEIRIEIFDSTDNEFLLQEKIRVIREPLFDEDYYKATNQDIVNSFLDPFLHYHLFGKKESTKREFYSAYSRNPHPLFDSYFYSKKLQSSQEDLISHYKKVGSKKNISPHPLFDEVYYKEQAGDLEGLSALEHYIEKGVKKGLNPHPLFDAKYYMSQVFDPGYEEIEPLVHFVNHGFLRGLDPHPDFDSHYYNITGNTSNDPVPVISYLSKNNPAEKTNKARQYLNSQNIYPDKKDFTVIATSHEASLTGAPRIILEILRDLSKNYNVQCYSLINRGGPLLDEFKSVSKVIDLEDARHSGVANIGSLIKEIYNKDSTFVIANSMETYKSMEAFHALGIPFISLLHEFSELYPQQIIRRVIQHANAIVFPAKIVEKNAIKVSEEKFEEKSYVAPQGFSREEFLTEDKNLNRIEVRKDLGLAPDTKIILGCGTVDIRKGADLFITIAKEVLNKENSDIKFVWLGKNDDASCPGARFRFWLAGDLERAGLSDKVLFVGRKEKVAKYFQAADVFLMTSRLDPFPYVALEAMHSELPVVMFDEGNGIAEFVDKETAAVVPYLDTLEATKKIIELVNNPILAKKIGKNAKKKIKQELSHEKYVETILDVLLKTSNKQTIDSFNIANKELLANKVDTTKKNYNAVA